MTNPTPRPPTHVLHSTQMRNLIALLEMEAHAPDRARRQLDRLARTGQLSPLQREAVLILFTLADEDIDQVLRMACADDQAFQTLGQLRPRAVSPPDAPPRDRLRA